MSGLEYLLSKSLSNRSSVEKPEEPEDFKSALDGFLGFCENQLPSILDTDFMPVCFDISKDEETLIIGGQHGNIAKYDIPGKRTIDDVDIDEVHGFAITSVLFVLNEQQVVLCSSKAEIHFLEYPSLKWLHKIELNYSPVELSADIRLNVVMKLGTDEEWLYYSVYSEEVQVVRLSTAKQFYLKRFESSTIPTSSKVTCLDVSDDGTLLAVGLDDGSIGLIHADTQARLQTTAASEQKPLIVAFSQHRHHLAAGFDDNTVKVWNLDANLTQIYEFTKHSEIVTGIAFVKDNRYMVTSSLDTTLVIWDMKVESAPYVMNLFDSKVLHFRASRDHKKVYYSQAQNNVMCWAIPSLHKNARYRKHSQNVNKIVFMPNSFEMLSIGSDGLVVLWDYRNDLLQDTLQLEGSLVNVAVSGSGEFAMILSSKPCIFRWDLSTGCTDEYEFLSAGVALSFSSDDYLVAISDSLGRVVVYDADVMEKKYVLKGHRGPVTGTAFILDNNYLLTASTDTEIIKWDMASGEKVATFSGHQNSIVNMTTSADGWVVTASDEAIIVWNYNGVQMYTMRIAEADAGRNKGIFLSQDHKYMITLQESCISYWQMDNLSVMFKCDTSTTAHCIAVSTDEKMVAIGEGDTIFVEESPMWSASTRLVGKNQGSRYKYMKFVIDSQKKNSKAVYSEEHNHWVLVPYLIGVTHILSYSNRIDDLSHSVFEAANKASFFSTSNRENPLSIAIELEYKNVIDICLRYMKQDLQKGNIRSYASLETCLTALNSIEYPGISKLYDIIFQKARGTHLPGFCLHEAELPILHCSEEIVVIPEDIVPKECFSSTGRPVVFHHSLCLLDTELGTTASLEFLESLHNGDKEVYNTRLVKEFLMSKWEKIQFAVNAQGCIYIIYMLLLSIYTINYVESIAMLSLVTIMHVVLVCLEILQLATDYRNYFFDVWNIFDQLRTWSFNVYLIGILVFDATELRYHMLLAIIVFSWLRGISYFRMYQGTRYMVRLLGMVIMDMRVFFTILTYSTVGFTFIFYLRHPETPFLLYLTTSYRLDLGDFNTDYTVVFDWVVFFLATMINPMIMLNLLISILSDTAAKVAADNYVANLQELTRMIIEIERVMFWKKDVTAKHSLQLCCFVEDDPQPDKILERCKFIKKKMDKLQNILDGVNDQMSSVNVAQIETSVKHMVNEQQAIKEEMNYNFQKNNEMLKMIEESMVKRGL